MRPKIAESVIYLKEGDVPRASATTIFDRSWHWFALGPLIKARSTPRIKPGRARKIRSFPHDEEGNIARCTARRSRATKPAESYSRKAGGMFRRSTAISSRDTSHPASLRSRALKTSAAQAAATDRLS